MVARIIDVVTTQELADKQASLAVMQTTVQRQEDALRDRDAALREEERKLKARAAMLSRAEHDVTTTEQVRLWSRCHF